MTVLVITSELFYPQYPCAAGQHFGDGFHFDIAQTACIQKGRPALIGCEQAFQRAGSKTGKHKGGLPPGIQ